MGWSLHKAVTILPGVRINVSKSGLGLSLGWPPFVFSIGPRGTRTTVGIPGTGLSWVSSQGRRRRA